MLKTFDFESMVASFTLLLDEVAMENDDIVAGR
jgi:hypothetical protein